MNKKQKFKRNVLIFSLLALAIFLFAGGGQLFSVFQAPPEFLPYGESGNVVTGLNLISDFGVQAQTHTDYFRTYDSTYWTIETRDNSQDKSPNPFSFNPSSSDDFRLTNDRVLVDDAKVLGSEVAFTSKQFFGKGKGFRLQFDIDNDAPQGANINLNLIDTNNNILSNTNKVLQSGTNLLEIESSPVVNTVQIYWNGQLSNTLEITPDFKLKIKYSPPTWGGNQQLTHFIGRVSLLNPAYKDPFNCNVKPDEQYYKFYFMEGSTVSKAGLENFNHWCLDTSPLEIYTNAGKTTDRMVLVALENGNSYPVPAGSIYAVEYIGDKKELITPCEQDEVLLNGNECKARTVLELQFICQGGTLNTATGECIPSSSNETIPPIVLQTQAVDYIKSDIQTYQFLAENSKFRFTIIQDDNTMTSSSFDLLGQNFMSEIPSSFSSASFSWGDKTGTLIVGEIMPLDERLKVKLSRVELQDIADVGVGDTQKYLVEWTFELNTQFIVPSYDASKKEIIIKNNYYPFNGGLSISKKNNLGVSTTESKRAEFLVGETRIPIDTSGLLQFSVRPYIEIITPDAEFRLATAIPMTVSDLQETQAIVNVPTQPTTKQIVPLEKTPEGGKEISAKKEGLSFGIWAGIILGILVGLFMIYFIIRSFIKMIRRR